MKDLEPLHGCGGHRAGRVPFPLDGKAAVRAAKLQRARDGAVGDDRVAAVPDQGDPDSGGQLPTLFPQSAARSSSPSASGPFLPFTMNPLAGSFRLDPLWAIVSAMRGAA